ncbi:hypothetical protein J1614_010776, partial [Plenodomus biglobosus]
IFLEGRATMSDHESGVDRSRDSTSMDKLPRGDTPASAHMVSSPAVLSLPGFHWRPPHQLAEPSRIRPRTSQFLNNTNYKAAPNGLYFQNGAEALHPMSNLQWIPPANDVSVPRSDEEDRQVVAYIVGAVKSMTEAKDTIHSAYLKRFKPQQPYYQEWAIEACAWDVLFLAKQIHTQGFSSRLYDTALIDAIGETQHWRFEDRVGWICLALKTSKNVAVNLLKKEKVMTIVGAPHKLHKATLVNTKSNANRGIWTANGRDADLEHRNRPFKKRTDFNGLPLPLPKRHVPTDEERDDSPDRSAKKVKVSRVGWDRPIDSCKLLSPMTCNYGRELTHVAASPPAQSSPSPSPLAAKGPRPRSSHSGITASLPAPPPTNYEFVAFRSNVLGSTPAMIAAPVRSNNDNKDVDMADAPNQPITSFSLEAINRRIGYKLPTSNYKGDIKVEASPTVSSGVGGGSSPKDRGSASISSIVPISNTEGAARASNGDAEGNYDANVSNSTVTAPASPDSSTAIPTTNAESNAETNGPAEFDAAYALTLLQRGFAG